MKLTQEQINESINDATEALLSNGRKNTAIVYPQGFVANAYRYAAPATRIVVQRIGMGKFVSRTEGYDRKRSYGKGRYITLWNQLR